MRTLAALAAAFVGLPVLVVVAGLAIGKALDRRKLRTPDPDIAEEA